jgi:hypothetical protein
MWKCANCGREFDKANQPHSCRTKPLEEHFKNKAKARVIFDRLVEMVTKDVGEVEIISIPCCIHLFGKYDFLAALPKKEGLEIRLALHRVLQSPRLKVSVPLSRRAYKHCIFLREEQELDQELAGWIREAYHLKDLSQPVGKFSEE